MPRWLRLLSIKLASYVNLLAHYAKGTLSLMLQLLQLTPSFVATHGTAWKPWRWGWLHRSLTVLYAIDRGASALGMGFPTFGHR